MRPDTQYTKASGDVNIAYQVFGEGPRDLVIAPGWIFHLDMIWDVPEFEACMARLAQSFRVVLFDKRGTGLSDRAPGATPLEARMDDVRAVMDATGVTSATLLGWSEGGSIAALFAATHPERVDALILYGAAARFTRGPDDDVGYPEDYIEAVRQAVSEKWGTGLTAYVAVPSRADDPEFVAWAGRYERASVSPAESLAMFEVNMAIDITSVLDQVTTPTLVLHERGDHLVSVDMGRHLAEHIPGAKFVEFDGIDHLFWFSDTDAVVGEIEEFLLGARQTNAVDRVLSTVLFTDLVGSTEMAAEVGDETWRRLLDEHDRLVGSGLQAHRGRLVKSTGDGVLATFDGPARALSFAGRLRDGLAGHGLGMRAGAHTGEIELRGDDVTGIAVNIAARIADRADAGEVLASRTVKDLVAGSGISFAEKGTYALKGVPDEWPLFTASV